MMVQEKNLETSGICSDLPGIWSQFAVLCEIMIVNGKCKFVKPQEISQWGAEMLLPAMEWIHESGKRKVEVDFEFPSHLLDQGNQCQIVP